MTFKKYRKCNERNVSTNTQAFYNILSTIILSGINFFTTPLFTRVLGAEQYGLYSVLYSWVTIVACFVTLGCSSGLGTAKYIFPEHYKEYKSSSLMFGLLVAAALTSVAFLFRGAVSKIIGYPSSLVLFIFVFALSTHLVEFAKNMFVYEKKAEKNFILSVSLALLNVGLSLLFLNKSFFQEKYLSRAYGHAIPYIITAVLFILFTFKAAPPKYNKTFWKYSFTMGFPIVFHTLSHNILKQSDRIMMQHMGYTDVDVGIYSFFCTYTAIVSVVLSALNTTWCPFYYDDLNQAAYEKLKVKCRNYLELFTIITCGFLLVSREVCYVFSNSEYWSGMNVIPLLILGTYFVFMYQFPVNFEFYNRKTQIIAIGTFSAAIVNILFNLLFIPKHGMYGAAFATAISYGLLFVAHYIIVNHMKKMKFHMEIASFIPGFIVVLSFLALFYMMSSLWLIRWILGAAIGIFELARIIKRKTIF